MKVGVLGTGDVGKALGKAFLATGHEVKMGAREAGNEKAAAWVKESGERASAGTFAEVASWADLVLLCTLGSANESALKMAGPGALAGKVLIDTTNPLDFSNGFPPSLSVGHTDSGGEQVQRAVPGAKVVKAFNIVGNAHMFQPKFPGGPPTMFIAGDDDGAKKQVSEILVQFGWEVADLGGIAASRMLEPMCLAWVVYASKQGTWNHAFKMLKQ